MLFTPTLLLAGSVIDNSLSFSLNNTLKPTNYSEFANILTPNRKAKFASQLKADIRVQHLPVINLFIPEKTNRSFTSSNLIRYRADVNGLRNYLENELKHHDESTYDTLNAQVYWLGFRKGLGGIISFTGIVVGAVMIAISSNAVDDEQQSDFDENSSELGLQGLIILLGGAITGKMIQPDHQSIYKVLKKHNQLNKGNPLIWSKNKFHETKNQKISLQNISLTSYEDAAKISFHFRF